MPSSLSIFMSGQHSGGALPLGAGENHAVPDAIMADIIDFILMGYWQYDICHAAVGVINISAMAINSSRFKAAR